MKMNDVLLFSMPLVVWRYLGDTLKINRVSDRDDGPFCVVMGRLIGESFGRSLSDFLINSISGPNSF